ncbi:Glucose/arabinose dehydrogenase, beta-propeller fold [Meinhardsimonia xiamenensis]|jgi:glucose/arabinose dehydrogenase|uniref:Glucose/arabinose dehydrogenase, beta-propeller fold n=1 Tax=Meinhardsimonia xiamenensis TaxID=990712 RepID=A0A1G9CS70_9RHOB|nr:PQQ-dependent sugar dehydrogenase [Meinhardsimonia xiamenensis]PRX38265.1 glucose/arabinose dehydrogenase [Meinhardsimonia xiamenensis]SDK54502.1 Glucose/arabinose dehydrogenase, beta-propeller fold [Meinhardsimonia xiamenensis]
MNRLSATVSAVMLGALALPAAAADYSKILERIRLPEGFKISIFAEMPKARSIEVGKPLGVVYVGSRHGYIYSMVDYDRDGVADEVKKRVDGLNVPNGVAMQDAILYVGMQDRIAYWPVPAEFDTALPIEPLVTILDGIDEGFLHGWRYIDFGPDRKLYVSLGAPCNICELKENTGKIIRMDPDGSNVEVVADGVRNSVGFDWHPVTGELWFTDNGADGMGDDIPPDELNRVTKIGQHFGFPYYGGKSVKLTGYEDKEPPFEVTPPEIEFQAHSANLGIDFYTGDMFPAEYRNDAFVAQHGSWNRTEPVGYRIMRIRFDENGNAVGKEVFADGWLGEDGAAVGRPVDIEELPDGSLLVSDDFAGVIYRISYGE